MKQDPTDLQTPDPDKYWKEAEKLLDAHYRQKRRKKRGLLLFAFLCLSTGTFYLLQDKIEPGETGTYTDSKKINSGSGLSQNTMENPDGFDDKPASSPATPDQPVAQSQKQNESHITGSERKKNFPKEQQLAHPGRKSLAKHRPEPILKNESSGPDQDRKTENRGTEFSGYANQQLKSAEAAVSEKHYTPDRLMNDDQAGISGTSEQEAISLLQPGQPKLFHESEPHIILDLTEKPGMPAAEPGRSGYGLSGSVYVYTHNVSKILSADSRSEYLDRRENEEKNLVVPGAGIKLDLIKKNLSFSIGAEYASLGEKTNYDSYRDILVNTYRGEWQTYLRTIVDTDTAYISGLRYFLETQINKLDSNYTTVIDSSREKVTDPTIAERNGNVRFSYIEIPLVATYTIPVKRFTIGICAGISPAWLITEKGYYLKPDQSGVISVSELKPLKTFILNARAGLNLGYQLNPRWNVFIGPHMKKNLGNISNSSQQVKQRYTSTGINAGLVYRIR